MFALTADSASTSVGRGESADVRIDWDDQVSRLHARFERVGADWDVVDDGFSSNGTFVNGDRVSGRRRLRDGDTVRFGSTHVKFRCPGAAHPGEPGAAAAIMLSTTQRRVLAALCRPYKDASGSALPATDEEIAEELVLSVGEVRTHLRVLGAKLGLDGLTGDAARARLVDRALSTGLISEQDL